MMIEDRRWVVQVLRLRSRTGTGLEMIVAEEAINLQHVWVVFVCLYLWYFSPAPESQQAV